MGFERIKELVDFFTTESPYRSANKGWITDDVYVKWGSSSQTFDAKGQELINVSILWKPINEILLILFTVVFLASIFVFSSISIAKGHFQLALPAPIEEIKEIDAGQLSIELETPQKNINEEVPPQTILEEVKPSTDKPGLVIRF